MSGLTGIREGMPVYGSYGQPIGTVERVHGRGFDVGGRHIEREAIARVDGERVYLHRASGEDGAPRGQRAEGEIVVPVAEERLSVETRQAELGAVEVRKTVEQEQVSVPVDLEREEVRVGRQDVGDRLVGPGDRVFEEGTIRVPVRGEEAVVSKEAVVTGEVVIEKGRTTEREQVADVVRRERVEVDDTTRRERPGGEDTAPRAGAGLADRGAAETRTSASAGASPAATSGAGLAGGRATESSRQAREGMEVVGSDGERVGLVKEVRAGDLLVDRAMRRDLYVPLDAVREVTGERVVLTIPADEADDQGWPNPPLL
jgi:uncharacterized protein (TIGR02271 family)